MMMNWKSLLRYVMPSASHPAPESVVSLELSSWIKDSKCWIDWLSKVFEMLGNDYVSNSPEDDTPRVLQTFVSKLPTRGQLMLMTEIELLKSDSAKLRQLRDFLVDALLKPMTVAGARWQDSQTPITPVLDTNVKDDNSYNMPTVESSSANDQRLLKADCLRREGYRCALTDMIDGNSRHKVPCSSNEIKVITHCVHIIPYALGLFEEHGVLDTPVWWALYRYFPDIEGLIGPASINQHRNAITMQIGLHAEFGNHNLALEPLGNVKQNRYRTWWLTYRGDDRVPDVITLTSHDPSVPLPNPLYFSVHFRIAEILEESGIREKIEDAWDREAYDPDDIEASGSTDLGSILTRKFLTGI